MTQKNYFSNVIINNFKSKEEHKNYSTSQNKTKEMKEEEKKKEKQKLNEIKRKSKQ